MSFLGQITILVVVLSAMGFAYLCVRELSEVLRHKGSERRACVFLGVSYGVIAVMWLYVGALAQGTEPWHPVTMSIAIGTAGAVVWHHLPLQHRTLNRRNPS